MAADGQPGSSDLTDAASALQGVKILAAPSPAPIGRRTYTPKPPPIDGLTDAVWENYTENKGLTRQSDWTYRMIPVPPEYAEAMRAFLLQAKNWLNWKHETDIRGLDKKDVDVIDPAVVTDRELRKQIPKGMVAVRFAAREPLDKGNRVRQARLAARGRSRAQEVSGHDPR